MAIRRRKITREKKQFEVSPADISTASDTELCDEPASAISVQLPKEPGEAATVAANATVQPADTVPDDLIQPIAQTKHASSPVSGNKRTGIQNRKLSILEIALIAGVILSTALLTYSLKIPSGTRRPTINARCEYTRFEPRFGQPTRCVRRLP
jgi:hypothetical protein